MSDFSLIVVAAGSGTRMQSATKKAFIEIQGRPLLLHTLEAFKAVRGIAETILVVPPEMLVQLTGHDEPKVNLQAVEAPEDELGRELQDSGVNWLVRGGERRQDSVHNGLRACSAPTRYVLIHDAARPFVSREDVSELMAKVRETGAAILALPVKDTLKSANEDGVIQRTVDRRQLWAAQTPQGFDRVKLAECFTRYGGADVTDDAQLFEIGGLPVHIVQGDASNFKITTPDDLKLAERALGGLPTRRTTRRVHRPPSAVFTQLTSSQTVIDLHPPPELNRRQPADAFADALAAYRSREFERAIDLAREAVKARPDFADAWSLKAGAHDALGQVEQALESARMAARVAPSNPQWWVNYGFLLLGARHYREADEAYAGALALDPHNLAANFNRAFALVELGEAAEARAHLERAFAIKPELRDAAQSDPKLAGLL